MTEWQNKKQTKNNILNKCLYIEHTPWWFFHLNHFLFCKAVNVLAGLLTGAHCWFVNSFFFLTVFKCYTIDFVLICKF